MHYGLSHPVDIFGAFSFSLLQTYVAYHLCPASLQGQLLEVFSELFFLLEIVTRPLSFLLLFLVPKLLKLGTTLLLALLLVLPFLILSR